MALPRYLANHNKKKLKKITQKAFGMLASCAICPRACHVDRLKDRQGYCKTGLRARVYSSMLHHGEEPPISGTTGSGAIFFSGCNMACVYCQNFEFSQSLRPGRELSNVELADCMVKLQEAGAHNINLVSPTHVMPMILAALTLAIDRGLVIPLVYNTGGYELPRMIEFLDGIVDVYLPDMRYADDQNAIAYSHASGYAECNQAAVREMYRQVGVAKINSAGIIEQGMIIRHLVLPENISGTEKIMEFIRDNLTPETYVSLMSQYHPCYRAGDFPKLSRRLKRKEYERARTVMHACGIYNGWVQDSGGLERFLGTNIKSNL
jgi:putative pyruvate formate lyase activating enzyme